MQFYSPKTIVPPFLCFSEHCQRSGRTPPHTLRAYKAASPSQSTCTKWEVHLRSGVNTCSPVLLALWGGGSAPHPSEIMEVLVHSLSILSVQPCPTNPLDHRACCREGSGTLPWLALFSTAPRLGLPCSATSARGDEGTQPEPSPGAQLSHSCSVAAIQASGKKGKSSKHEITTFCTLHPDGS